MTARRKHLGTNDTPWLFNRLSQMFNHIDGWGACWMTHLCHCAARIWTLKTRSTRIACVCPI